MELIPLQVPDSTYTKSILQTFQPREQLLPLLGTKTSSIQLFSAKMTNANFHQTPKLVFFLLDPLMIYWEKQKVIWCVRWEECCWRSDMGTGVRPVLFSGRRHFWLKAACCWELPLSTYANLETAYTQSISAQIHTHKQHVWGQSGLHATSQSISQRRSFHNAEQSDKGKNKRRELRVGAARRYGKNFYWDCFRKSESWMLRNRWYCDVQTVFWICIALISHAVLWKHMRFS